MGAWMHGCMAGWLAEWMDGWMDGWTDRQLDSACGAKALRDAEEALRSYGSSSKAGPPEPQLSPSTTVTIVELAHTLSTPRNSG